MHDPKTMVNISLGKGLITNSLNTEDAFINENSFLFRLKQNFLSDYWKFNTILSDLATDYSSALNSRFGIDETNQIVSKKHKNDRTA